MSQSYRFTATRTIPRKKNLNQYSILSIVYHIVNNFMSLNKSKTISISVSLIIDLFSPILIT